MGGPRGTDRPGVMAFRGTLRWNRRGITLLELVTALTILAVAVGVAVPAFLSLGREDDLTRATRRIHTLFRLARDSAIRSGAPVTVVIDSVSQLVWIDTPPRIDLGAQDTDDGQESLFDTSPEDVNLALVGGAEALEDLVPGEPIGLPQSVRMELPRARTRFTFEPTGAALADTMLLSGPFGVRVVTVDPWTGDVRIG